MTVVDPQIEEFLGHIRKSGLMDAAALDAYLPTTVGATTARDLATMMVRDGMMTPFQAKMLLDGKHRGFVVAGKYKILDLIATGGMGAVYLCEHTLMRRPVAMKVLPKEQSAAPGAVERFLREARAAAALDHPNLVRAFDVDRLPPGNNYCLVMEFVDGVSLQTLVEKHGKLPVPRAVDYALQAATGLQHAHDNGLVHRDVKPSNLVLSRPGLVKILDLGLARFFEDKADNLTRQHGGNSVLGTADYIAPEQAMSGPVDTRADVYGLGCTLYFLLAGHPPFPDGNVTNKLLWHQTKEPTPVDQVRPGLPPGLAAVIGKMMAKKPDDRYPSLRAVCDALRPYLPGPVPPPDPRELPSVCAAVRKLLAETAAGNTANAYQYRAHPSTGEFVIPPAAAEPSGVRSAVRSGTALQSATLDLTDLPTWRGRPMAGGASTSGNGSQATKGNPTAANAKLFKLLVGGFVGVALLIAAMVAYQSNKPPEAPPAKAK